MSSWSFIRRIWERPFLRAAVATLPVLAITAVLFLEGRHSERLLLEAETSREADNAFLQFQGFATAHVDLLRDIGSYVLALSPENADQNFVPFVDRLLVGKTDFESVAWHDSAGNLRRTVPAALKFPAPSATSAALLKAAERKAAGTNQPICTPSFNLLSGQEAITGITVVVPLLRNGHQDGFVEGTVRLTRGIQRLFGRDISDFWNIEFYDQSGRCAYRALAEGQGASPALLPLSTERYVPVADHAWTLRIWPTPLLIASLHTGAPWRIVSIGLVTTLLLALANYLLTQHQARLAESLRESKRLAADVGETRRHLSELVNGVDAAIWESDAEMHHFTFVNEYARTLLGVPTDRWISRPSFWLNHVHPDDRERALANTRAVRAPGATHTEEYRMIDTEGNTLWVREIVTAIGAEGNMTGRRGVVVDITARVQAEEAVRQSQKLESLGVLAGGIAHDFNNLLTTILGNTEMLKPLLDNSSEPVRSHLDKIERTTRRLADLTRQMLAYSGRGRFSVERVDLNATIREMTELLTVSTPKNVRVTYRLDPALPFIEGASTQIRQVILNLLTNAAEAVGSDCDGSVLISTGAQDLDAEAVTSAYPGQELAPGRYVRLEVSDNGCGMNEETLSKIFDPFFSTKFTGRGLGLAALRGIVRGHHGGIQIISQLGEGTVFTLVFPMSEVRQAEVVALDPLAAAPSGVEHATVLVVDDEEGLRSLMVAALEETGCTVHEAFDGVDALEKFAVLHDEIDLVVLDLTMPRLGGEVVFQRIREQHPGTPVILCSGYTEEDIVHRFDGQAPAAFIEKPFKPSELIKCIGAVLADSTSPLLEPPLVKTSITTANTGYKNGRKAPAGKA